MDFKRFSSWLLYRRMRWETNVTVPLPRKFIACVAPHTSNWDFIIGFLYMRAEGLRINFLMKHEWFVGPLAKLFRGLGGIPVWRETHSNLTESLAREAAETDTFRLCITPEGTRSLNPDWKMGFYYIAAKAGLPILLYALDYERRVIECTMSVCPSGDVREDMRRIKLYYKDVRAKHPENFTVGVIP